MLRPNTFSILSGAIGVGFLAGGVASTFVASTIPVLSSALLLTGAVALSVAGVSEVYNQLRPRQIIAQQVVTDLADSSAVTVRNSEAVKANALRRHLAADESGHEPLEESEKDLSQQVIDQDTMVGYLNRIDEENAADLEDEEDRPSAEVTPTKAANLGGKKQPAKTTV